MSDLNGQCECKRRSESTPLPNQRGKKAWLSTVLMQVFFSSCFFFFVLARKTGKNIDDFFSGTNICSCFKRNFKEAQATSQGNE